MDHRFWLPMGTIPDKISRLGTRYTDSIFSHPIFQSLKSDYFNRLLKEKPAATSRTVEPHKVVLNPDYGAVMRTLSIRTVLSPPLRSVP